MSIYGVMLNDYFITKPMITNGLPLKMPQLKMNSGILFDNKIPRKCNLDQFEKNRTYSPIPKLRKQWSIPKISSLNISRVIKPINDRIKRFKNEIGQILNIKEKKYRSQSVLENRSVYIF